MDEADRVIVQSLAKNGRGSLQVVADQLGLSRATVHERVRKLTNAGVLRAFRADVDWTALGFHVMAWVALQTDQGKSSYQVLDDLAQIKEVDAAYLVTGRFDCLVKIRARDHQDLQRVLFDELGKVGGFRRAETMVVLSTPFENKVDALFQSLSDSRP